MVLEYIKFYLNQSGRTVFHIIVVKPSNLNKIQIFQSKCLRQITKAPYYISNDTLHRDLGIPIVQNVEKTYKRLHSKCLNHYNPLISELSTNAISGDPRR
ncbi:zinc finger MYM-type protein 6-like [Aphis craccivora]|uniref:Zinc finger MYM-type protein 6-like n=1 Tax=Aphis craccivora TaxID=307492 RepID=A0A6G0ZHU3_APHCR|nr:zinc finger MYM-type protein 6-like [Aphis craccivora]